MQKRDNRPKERTAEEALAVLEWLCAKMERCESDVKKSLYRWKVPKEQWDWVLEKLKQGRYVDNERYAAAYAREKSRLSGWGTVKIVNNLRTKGIEREIIASVIDEYIDKNSERSKLEEFIVKRIERDTPKSKNKYDLRCKVFRAAASKGFDFDVINDLLSKHIED